MTSPNQQLKEGFDTAETPQTSALRLVLVLTAGLLAVSASAILIRLAKAPSLSIAFWRVSFSLLFLLPLWLGRSRWQAVAALDRKQRLLLLASGLCLGVHFWAWIASLAYTSVAASVLLVTTNPLWVGLLSPWLLGERLNRQGWAGVGLAMLGATIVTFLLPEVGNQAPPNPLLGNALALLGAIASSGYLMLGRRVRPSLDIWSYASATLFGAWLVLGTGVLITATPTLGFEWREWGLFLAMALLPQMVGHNAISWSLRYIRANTVAMLLLLEPIGSALLAWLFLAEWPSRGVWWGGPLLLAGVAWVVLAGKKSTNKAEGAEDTKNAESRKEAKETKETKD